MFRFLDQPRGMIVIGFTEVFERLSYYTLAALLVLYASASIEDGGLGWTKEASLLLMGKYTLAAFTVPLLGGYLVDKFLGPYKASIIGAIMIISGHGVIYFSNYSLVYFYSALTLVVSGTALFKPSMPVLLGMLYSPTDHRRAGGFSLYYMCINIGGMIAGFSGGILLQVFGYQAALSSAGVGMTLGLMTFLIGSKHLIKYKSLNILTTTTDKIESLTNHHKKALFYLLFSFIFYAIWAVVYNIVNSGTLYIYIQNYTQKTVFGYDIPTTFFSSLEPIGIVIFAPLVTAILTYFAHKKRPIHFFSQMNIALLLGFVAIAYFTYLTKISEAAGLETKPFHFSQLTIFILIISLSELLISPVMMASISVLSPEKYRTSFQALYLAVIGLMGLLAGKIGATSLSHPYQTFYTLSAVTLGGLLLFTIMNRVMVRAADNAVKELEHHKVDQLTAP